MRKLRQSWRSSLLASLAALALASQDAGLQAQSVSLIELRAAVEGTWRLEEWHVDGQVLRPPQAEGRWSNHDGAVLFMVHRTTSAGAYSQTGYGTYQLDASNWSYGYARMETSSGPVGCPAQITTERRDSRSFSVSRQGNKIVLTLKGPGDDRREYDGSSFTLIQNGQVVRKWRRVGQPNDANAAPAMGVLMTLEKSAYDAWKSKDAKFWDAFLSDSFVGWGSSGRLDKASATREYTGADCEINRYGLSDERMKPLGNDAALITFRATVDGTCAGQKLPAESRAASVYVRDGDRWQAVFHAEAAIVDPKVAPAKPAVKQEPSSKVGAGPARREAATDAMLVVEKAVWEAWRSHDANQIESLTASDISFINIFGTYLATKADALKDWTGVGCDARSVSVTDAAGTMLSPTVGINVPALSGGALRRTTRT